MLGVELAGQRGRMTNSGHNVTEDEKIRRTSSKPSEIEPWLLMSVNRKSRAAYHLPYCRYRLIIGGGISFRRHRGDTAR